MSSAAKVSVLCLLLVAACSGADETELFGVPPQESNPTTPIGGSSDAGSSSSSDGSSSGGETTNGGGSGGSSSSSGATSEDAGTPPPPACAIEVEPNGSAGSATPFTSCIDGSLKKGDVDFVEIKAPAQATKIAIGHTETGGKVSYRVYINGMPFPAFTGDAPDYIPGVTSATYRFQIQPSGNANGTRTYRLTVSFE